MGSGRLTLTARHRRSLLHTRCSMVIAPGRVLAGSVAACGRSHNMGRGASATAERSTASWDASGCPAAAEAWVEGDSAHIHGVRGGDN